MAEIDSLDEMVDGQGGLRPHWRGLMGAFSDLGREAMIERRQGMERALADGFFGLSSHASALWSCDSLPLPLAGSEFTELEAGLAQRAALLEAVLQDVYGPQRLLADGLLPPAMVFANPHFLRPSARLDGRQSGPLLTFYAADLMRGQDGRWRVLADRTDEAGGVAVALENRRLMSRLVPELFQAVEAEQIHPFFDSWQDVLQRSAPLGVDNPGVALLTSGPNDALWFEHVILSRELSCTLVEAGDLTVRGGELFLKTLRGLQRIDVLIRRQDGRTIDPLELTPGGNGIPGLLDAQRTGTVRIVNDPGAGFAESPGLMAFLPAISQSLTGERLVLGSLTTHWLGNHAERARVLGTLPAWHIRSAFDGSTSAVLNARGASPNPSRDARQKLLAKIEENPWEYCASAIQTPSTAPSVSADGLVARPLILRLFLMWNGKAWQTMRGGLARMLTEDDLLYGRLPRSGLAKDVWVLVEDRARVIGPAAIAVPPIAIRRTRGELPSRVADDFFWFGRYLERLEGTARLLRAVIVRLARVNLSPREMADLRVLIDCLADKGAIDEELVHVISLNRLGDTLIELGREGGWLAGLLAALNALKEGLRDRLTEEIYNVVSEALRDLGGLLREVPKAGQSSGLERLAQAMHRVITVSATIAGLTSENMVRGGGRLFVDLGRRIERAQTIASEVNHVLSHGTEKVQAGRIEAGLRLAIELCDSVITYRNRYLTVLQPAPALDLVLADESNPRALAYQLCVVRDLLTEIAGGDAADPLAATAAGLLRDTAEAVEDVAHSLDQTFAAAKLPARLQTIGSGVAALSDRVTRQYFALLTEAQSIGIDEEQEREPLLGVA